MNESETPTAATESRTTPRRRAPARRKAPARPKAASRPTAGASSRRKTAASPVRRAGRGGDLQGLLRKFARKASDAKGRLATASGGGARATREAWQKVSGASRRSIDRLAAQWKQMDTARKAQVLAALLTALAAASAPIVRRGLKKR